MTMHGILTHQFIEAIDTQQIYHKTGTVKILWGLIEYPSGWHEQKKIHLGRCRICLQKEATDIHGYFEADKVKI